MGNENPSVSLSKMNLETRTAKGNKSQIFLVVLCFELRCLQQQQDHALPVPAMVAQLSRFFFCLQLSDYELPDVSARLEELREKLPGVRVEALIDREPQIMKVRAA